MEILRLPAQFYSSSIPGAKMELATNPPHLRSSRGRAAFKWRKLIPQLDLKNPHDLSVALRGSCRFHSGGIHRFHSDFSIDCFRRFIVTLDDQCTRFETQPSAWVFVSRTLILNIGDLQSIDPGGEVRALGD